jgi:hypothetical protein
MVWSCTLAAIRTLRAYSVKVHMISDNLKVLSGTLRQREIKVAEDINDLFAREADEVMVRLGIGIKALLIGIDAQFLDKPLLSQHLQRIVDGGEGHGGETLCKGPVNIGGRGVGQIPFEVFQNGKTLRGKLNVHLAKPSFSLIACFHIEVL